MPNMSFEEAVQGFVEQGLPRDLAVSLVRGGNYPTTPPEGAYTGSAGPQPPTGLTLGNTLPGRPEGIMSPYSVGGDPFSTSGGKQPDQGFGIDLPLGLGRLDAKDLLAIGLGAYGLYDQHKQRKEQQAASQAQIDTLRAFLSKWEQGYDARAPLREQGQASILAALADPGIVRSQLRIS